MLRSILQRFARRVPSVARRHVGPRTPCTCIEALESRILLSADLAGSNIDMHPNFTASPLASAGPTGMTPAQVRQAYGFTNITFANGAIPGDGAGTTIAIVDAYDHPNIASDLHQFDVRFGLPDPVFTKVNQTGGTAYPTPDAGWAGEIALDVEWAHAIAPKANILLVEATDNSMSNLMAAVDYARHVAGVVAISMSWGGNEFSGESVYDSYFTTPAGHAGITFFVSSGDNGAPVSYPAASPNVVSVGGTTLNVDATGQYQSESGWSGSGGGVSAYESQPAYQKGVVTQSTTKRANPDVAYDSNPNTGFPVYNSYGTASGKPWEQYGGTSAAAPQWAALTAIVDQGRALAGLGSLDGATQFLPRLYSLPSSDFHDVTSGSSSGKPVYTASAGYDLVTGRGTPLADLVVRDLVGSTSTTPNPTPAPAPATHFSIATNAGTATAGTSFTITVTALDASNNVVPGYAGIVRFTSSDTQGLLPSNYAFTTADQGVHTFTGVTLKTAGSQNVKVADTSSSALIGTLTLTVTAGAAQHLAYVQNPTNVTAGATLNPAITVRILDAYNNLLIADNTDTITLSLGNNPGGSTLSGTVTQKVAGGIATFSGLSLNQIGVGYTLVAKSGTLPALTSSPFDVTSRTTRLVEGFEGGSFNNYYYVGGFFASANISTAARHDGVYGMVDKSGPDWIFRDDSTVHVQQGDTISVWMEFSGAATGVAAFGFGASSGGTLAIVASPYSNQLLLTNNSGFGSTTMGSANQTWQANHWYRLEVSWSTTGAITGKVFDSNGTTQLQTVTATTNVIRSGGIAFKANDATAYWDSVQVTSNSPGTTTNPRATAVGRGLTISSSQPTNLATLGSTQTADNQETAGTNPGATATIDRASRTPSFGASHAENRPNTNLLDSLFVDFNQPPFGGTGRALPGATEASFDPLVSSNLDQLFSDL